MTINPHPSYCRPSWESTDFKFFLVCSISLVYQKAKNVENGLTYVTHTFGAGR